MKQAKKISLLNMNELSEDFFADARLLGITATLKNYKFCLELNQTLGYQFRMSAELEIELRRKNRNYYFPVFKHTENMQTLTHYLYQNQYDGEYLLPEFKHMDFLWLLKGDSMSNTISTDIVQIVKSITGVQLVAELNHEQIKNKGNMVF
jgi:hypothetical protein